MSEELNAEVGKEADLLVDDPITEITPDDVGSVADILGVEASETTPEAEVEKVVEVEKIDWSPLEPGKIFDQVQKIHRYLLKHLPLTPYRAKGKTAYVAYTLTGWKARTVANIRLSKSKALLRLGHIIDGKVKFFSYKLDGKTITRDDEKLTLPAIVKHIKEFAEEKWA